MLAILVSLSMTTALHASDDLRPVTVAVVDRDSGAPVASFRYRAWHEAQALRALRGPNEWIAVESKTGTVEVQAPPSCRLTVMVMAPDFIGGYPGSRHFVLKKDDAARRVVVKLRGGITVEGTVRDAKTGKPITGAAVSPIVPAMPGWDDDEEKRVKTGDDGRYRLRGVDPKLGVFASHPDYFRDLPYPDGRKTGMEHDVSLHRGLSIEAKVVDGGGKPLQGATAEHRDDRTAVADKDGRLGFETTGLILNMTFHKDGFIDQVVEMEDLRREMRRPGGLVVALKPSIVLTGRVIGPDGRPVEAFTIAAGPGKLPSRRTSHRRDVRDPQGRFRLDLSKEGTTWVGVVAEGFAPWEGESEVKRGGAPMEVRLPNGVVVTAKVDAPQAIRGLVNAKLLPRRDKTIIGGLPAEPPSETLATHKVTSAADGSLRFEHVRPDRYRLILCGQGVPEEVLAVDVPEAGLDVGAVRVAGPTATGRIEGRIWRPKDKGGKPWAFADGLLGKYVRPVDEEHDDGEGGRIKFRADEDGRFRLENVPAGLTEIGFPYMVFDVIEQHTWSVLVVEGRTTVLNGFDPEARREFTLAFAIGDGSDAHYKSGTALGAARKVDNVNVMPSGYLDLFEDVDEDKDKEKAKDKAREKAKDGDGDEDEPMQLDFEEVLKALEKMKARAEDKGKAKAPPPREPMFRVELIPVSREPLFFAQPDWHRIDERRKVVLPDVGPGTYRLGIHDWLGWGDLESGPLFDEDVVVPPGGRGQVVVPLGAGCVTGKVAKPTENFKRPVEATAVAKGGEGPIRRQCCDDDGNFCVRYLTPGIYSLFVRDPKAGYIRIDEVNVPAGVVDVGELAYKAGATLKVEVRFARPTRVPDEIVAVDPSGVTVRGEFEVYSSFDRMEFSGLWPGRWTVKAMSKGEVLATSDVEVEETGEVEAVLKAGAGPGG